MKIRRLENLKKTIFLPADKSISHRAVMLSSIAKDKTLIKPFLRSDDTLATLDCVKKLGVKTKFLPDGSLLVKGVGLYFPKRKKVVLNAQESGTTMRILTGLLCAQRFPTEFRGSAALNKRPMGRIIRPLTKMNAKFKNKEKKAKVGRRSDIYPPLKIEPTDKIKGGEFNLKIASAQVKSAIMLASLYADKETIIEEPYKSRDHTERMLELFGVDVQVKGNKIICKSSQELISPGKIFIPSDFSSAAFFLVLGLISKNSTLTLKDININPTRCGLFGVLRRMGADIQVINKKEAYEPYADIRVKSSQLRAITVEPSDIPAMIDEIPILCVAAAFAKGQTRIKGVGELKVKETDRIKSMLLNLKRMGVDISAEARDGDWMISIKGRDKFKPAHFFAFGDHRTAMSMIVAGTSANATISKGGFFLGDSDLSCIDKSFPEFIDLYNSITKP